MLSLNGIKTVFNLTTQNNSSYSQTDQINITTLISWKIQFHLVLKTSSMKHSSPAEQEANQALKFYQKRKKILHGWFAVQCVKMMDIYNLATSKESMEIKQKHFSEFYTLFNSNNSEELWKHYQAFTIICTISNLAKLVTRERFSCQNGNPECFHIYVSNYSVARCW